ncbi:MAG: hypothetical protein WCJ81_09335 [bacterium]
MKKAILIKRISASKAASNSQGKKKAFPVSCKVPQAKVLGSNPKPLTSNSKNGL